MSTRFLALTAAIALGATPAAAQDPHAAHHAPPPSPSSSRAADSAFAALQARGKVAMGVDQYASTHRFDALPDGGRIELQQAGGDSAAIATIRAHLRQIATMFASGDFSTPAFVHMRDVPGTRVMAERRARITYRYRALPAGGELRIRTRDADALRAVHEFMAFQRGDHRAGGRH